MRIEHWANALRQPQAAARSMLGQDVAYDRVPYFFSDQYDLGMEYTGYVDPDGYDQVIFRVTSGRASSSHSGSATGASSPGMNVNVWDVTDPIQALVRSRGRVDHPGMPPF